MRNGRKMVNRLVGMILIFMLLLTMGIGAQAASDDIYFRAYDIGKLNEGLISAVLTREEAMDRGELSALIAGGVQLETAGNAESLSGQNFLYVIVLDESAPYYYPIESRKSGHATALVTAAKTVVQSANQSALFQFVWAGPSQGVSAVMDRENALKTINDQKTTIETNYAKKATNANLSAALSAAMQEIRNQQGRACSVILLSDCKEDIKDASVEFAAAGVPLHVWAIKHSNHKDQGTSDAGRKSAQTESAKTGGQYEEWDIYTTGTSEAESARISMGRIPAQIQRQESGTMVYTFRIPEEQAEAVRASENQSVIITYSGNPKAARIIQELDFSVVPTPVPVLEVTPTPVPTVRFGETSAEVLRLQELLAQKRYYDGALTGNYDSATQSALLKIWKENNRKVPDDQFETWTIDILDIIPNFGEMVTPTPEAIDLHQGMINNEYVTKLQDKLNSLGYFHLLRVNSGAFDDDTQRAIWRFCEQENQAKPEEGCNAALYLKIMNAKAAYIKPDQIPLRAGDQDRGDDHYVEALQGLLQEKGYLQGGYQLGMVDALTMSAVTDICADHPEWGTFEGEITEELQKKIRTAGNKPTPTPEPTATPKPDAIDLQSGAEGEYVSKLQNQLADLGYFHRLTYVNGTFDDATQEAVWRFCEQENQTKPAGGCSVALFRKILNAKTAYIKPDQIPLQAGDQDRGDDHYVETLQSLLSEKGYLQGGYQLGMVDTLTISAVTDICADHPEWGPFEGNITEELQKKIRTAGNKPTPTPEPTATPKPEAIDLQSGAEGEYVSKLQNQLADLGYFHRLTYVNGFFDDATQEAISRYCKEVRETAPAKGCSEALYKKIMATNVKYTKPEQVPLQLNDRDDEDRYIEILQTNLKEKGYLESGYQVGVMDQKTLEGIREACVQYGWEQPQDTVSVDLQKNLLAMEAKEKPDDLPEYVSLQLNDQDRENRKYVGQLQQYLKDLDYFVEGDPEWGRYDRITAAAVQLYKEQNTVPGDGNSISEEQIKALFQAKPAPMRKKGFTENFMSFVMGTISVGSLQIPVWLLIGVVIVLIFAIAIVLILAAHRKNTPAESHLDSSSNSGPKLNPGGKTPTNGSASHDAEETIGGTETGGAGSTWDQLYGTTTPGISSEDQPTDEVQFGGTGSGSISMLTFEVSFMNQTRTETIPFAGDLTIGRNGNESGFVPSADSSMSRRHCRLFYSGGRLMVQNLSRTSAGTILNGSPVPSGAQAASETAETSDNQFEEGMPVNSGDTLTLGRTTITLTY